MPENMSKNELNFSSTLRGIVKSRQNLISGRTEIKALAAKSMLEYVGDGTECAVISSGGEYKKVIAFNYFDLEPRVAKKIFYFQRILSTLFPHNFPHFYASFAGNEKGGTSAGTIRQRINMDNQPKVKYPFGQAEKILEELDVGVGFDTTTCNFGIGPDGGQYYLDTPFIYSKKLPKEKIINYMQDNSRQDGKKYDAYDIRLVSKSIDRLGQL